MTREMEPTAPEITWGDDRFDIRTYVEWRRKTQKMGWDRALCLDNHHYSRLTEATASECEKYGLDPHLVRMAVFDLNDQAVDELSLQLIERYLAKERLIADGESHLVRFGKAIPDSLTNELTSLILDGYCEKGETAPPMSLSVLVRAQLRRVDDPCYLPDAALADKKAMAAALLRASPQISARQVAKIIGTSNPTVSRWLADPRFQEQIASLPEITNLERLMQTIARRLAPS